jgi:hypothetical protein
MILIYCYTLLTKDSLEKSGAKFGEALRNLDSDKILRYLDRTEIDALDMDREKLTKLLNLTLSKNYPNLEKFEVITRKSDGILEVCLQEMDSKAGQRLSFAYVGDSGNFRAAGFVWTLLTIAGKKEFPRPEVSGGISSALSMADYIVAKESELNKIGIAALYNTDSKALVPFAERAKFIFAKYEEVKSKQLK